MGFDAITLISVHGEVLYLVSSAGQSAKIWACWWLSGYRYTSVWSRRCRSSLSRSILYSDMHFNVSLLPTVLQSCTELGQRHPAHGHRFTVPATTAEIAVDDVAVPAVEDNTSALWYTHHLRNIRIALFRPCSRHAYMEVRMIPWLRRPHYHRRVHIPGHDRSVSFAACIHIYGGPQDPITQHPHTGSAWSHDRSVSFAASRHMYGSPHDSMTRRPHTSKHAYPDPLDPTTAVSALKPVSIYLEVRMIPWCSVRILQIVHVPGLHDTTTAVSASQPACIDGPHDPMTTASALPLQLEYTGSAWSHDHSVSFAASRHIWTYYGGPHDNGSSVHIWDLHDSSTAERLQVAAYMEVHWRSARKISHRSLHTYELYHFPWVLIYRFLICVRHYYCYTLVAQFFLCWMSEALTKSRDCPFNAFTFAILWYLWRLYCPRPFHIELVAICRVSPWGTSNLQQQKAVQDINQQQHSVTACSTVQHTRSESFAA